MELTAVYIAVPEGYIAFVEELPGANTQGATLGRSTGEPQGSGATRTGGESRIGRKIAGRSECMPRTICLVALMKRQDLPGTSNRMAAFCSVKGANTACITIGRTTKPPPSHAIARSTTSLLERSVAISEFLNVRKRFLTRMALSRLGERNLTYGRMKCFCKIHPAEVGIECFVPSLV